LVGQEVNLDELLKSLVDRVARSMQADRGTLYLLDPSRGELFSRAAHLPELKQIRLKLGVGVAGQVAQSGEAINIPSTDAEQRFHGAIDKITGYKTKTLLAVPLKDGEGRVFGVLQVLNRLGGERFTDDDRARLLGFSEQLAQALQSTSLYTELERARAAPQS